MFRWDGCGQILTATGRTLRQMAYFVVISDQGLAWDESIPMRQQAEEHRNRIEDGEQVQHWH